MACEIPKDLDESWFLADIIIIAKNSRGKKIYAAKSALSMTTPFFRAMLFSSFKESNCDVIEVDYEYAALKDICCRCHHVGCDHMVDENYHPTLLSHLYSMADMMLIPRFKEHYFQLMITQPSRNSVFLAFSLNLRDAAIEMLSNMKPDEVQDTLLTMREKGAFFSKKDVEAVCKQFRSYNFPGPRILVRPRYAVQGVADGQLENDITLITSDNQRLYGNKELLCTISSHFKELYEHDDQNRKTVCVNEVYETMRIILQIVNTGVGTIRIDDENRWIPPHMIYNLARASSRFGMRILAAFCVNSLTQVMCWFNLELAFLCRLDAAKNQLIKDLPQFQLWQWVRIENQVMSTLANGWQMRSVPRNEPILTPREFYQVYSRLSGREALIGDI